MPSPTGHFLTKVNGTYVYHVFYTSSLDIAAGSAVYNIDCWSSVAITNSGKVSGVDSNGVYFHQNGSVTNEANGVFLSNSFDIFMGHGGSVYNEGLISTTSGTAVIIPSGGVVTNTASGRISGTQDGILGEAVGTIVNLGFVSGVLLGGGTITNGGSNNTTAVIEGAAGGPNPGGININISAG
jgi:hypothetical protein